MFAHHLFVVWGVCVVCDFLFSFPWVVVTAGALIEGEPTRFDPPRGVDKWKYLGDFVTFIGRTAFVLMFTIYSQILVWLFMKEIPGAPLFVFVVVSYGIGTFFWFMSQVIQKLKLWGWVTNPRKKDVLNSMFLCLSFVKIIAYALGSVTFVILLLFTPFIHTIWGSLI
jgi:hypothetical protein